MDDDVNLLDIIMANLQQSLCEELSEAMSTYMYLARRMCTAGSSVLNNKILNSYNFKMHLGKSFRLNLAKHLCEDLILQDILKSWLSCFHLYIYIFFFSGFLQILSQLTKVGDISRELFKGMFVCLVELILEIDIKSIDVRFRCVLGLLYTKDRPIYIVVSQAEKILFKVRRVY